MNKEQNRNRSFALKIFPITLLNTDWIKVCRKGISFGHSEEKFPRILKRPGRNRQTEKGECFKEVSTEIIRLTL